MDQEHTGRSDVAPKKDARFPFGRCGDSPHVPEGCGAALEPHEEPHGVCGNHHFCVLP